MVNLAGPRPLGNSIESMDLGFALQARCLEAVATRRRRPRRLRRPGARGDRRSGRRSRPSSRLERARCRVPFQLGTMPRRDLCDHERPGADLHRRERPRSSLDRRWRSCSADLRHPDHPPTTSGSPSAGAPAARPSRRRRSSAGRCGRGRCVVVTHTASADAAVHPARRRPSPVASSFFVTGSTRITPSAPAAQTEPNAATTPVASASFQRPAMRFVAGSMRSSSPVP